MKAQTTNDRAAGRVLRCMLAAILVATAVFAGFSSRADTAYAADESLSDATWEEVKGEIESLMGTPYVWGGKDTSGWDCSGFVGWVIANVYGLGWPGGSPGNCGTDAIAQFCGSHEVFRGSSAGDYNSAFDAGAVKPGDVIVFSNSSGATVHCAIAGEGATVYHAWYEGFGTGNCRFDYMWGINGGHGKAYASFVVYRGLSEGGHITLDKTSADVAVTDGNEEYTLAGAVYGVYQGGELVAQFTTDEAGHGQTSEKLPNGDYTVREISAPDGYALSQEEFAVTISGEDAHVDAADAPVTVDLTLVKKDAETLLPDPQGGASLDGAEYEATYLYGGEQATVAGVVENSELVFEGIPLGTVTIKETKAPEGYLPDPQAHEITVTADMAGSESAVFEYEVADELTEQVVRGDLELVKVSEGDQARMAGIPFSITSAATGESHVIVTDSNGYASTAASWNPHTADTNGGTSESGVWFGGGDPDDGLGALPYDTYIVEEQPCEANSDRELIPAFEVSVYRDGATVDLGTLTNADKPHVSLSKTDIATGEELPGATLQVIDPDGNVVEEWVSSDEPHEIVLDEGSYTLHEEIAPEGYLVANDVEFEVVSGQVAQKVTMEDDYTKVDFEKIDAGTGDLLPGASMQLLDESGNVVAEWVSGDEPHRIEKLEPGSYTLHEASAPEGYDLAADIEFEIGSVGEVQTVSMADVASAVPEGKDEPFDKTGVDLAPLAAATAVVAAAGLGCLAIAMRRAHKKDEEYLEGTEGGEER